MKKNVESLKIQKFRVAFEFQDQQDPLIIEMKFDLENKKILPDNKYFDKIFDNLKDKYPVKDKIKDRALERWNKYLKQATEVYEFMDSSDPLNQYGDYLILVLFLEMVQHHWSENNLSEKDIWYNTESVQKLGDYFPSTYLDMKTHEPKVKGGSQLNEVNDKLKVGLEKIVFIDDFPMEVVPQLFKLQKFCDKVLEIDVTPFNNGEEIDYEKDDNEERTKKVVRKVEKILGVEPNTPAEKNPAGDNLKPRAALSKLKFIWINHMNQAGIATDWFLDNLCGRVNTDNKEKKVYASYDNLRFEPNFDPEVNKKKYAQYLNNETIKREQTEEGQKIGKETEIKIEKEEEIVKEENNNNINKKKEEEKKEENLKKEKKTEASINAESGPESKLLRTQKEKKPAEEKNNEIKPQSENYKKSTILTWITLILFGIVFLGAPINALWLGVLFTLKYGIPVAGAMIISAVAIGLSINTLRKSDYTNIPDFNNGMDSCSHSQTFKLVPNKKQINKCPFCENESENKKSDIK